MSSKSKARLPSEPLTSMPDGVLAAGGEAGRLEDAERAAARSAARNTAASSTVTGPAARRRPCRREAGVLDAAQRALVDEGLAGGRRPRRCASPVMNWARSTMWAPMSPSAPEPALSLSRRHDSGASGRRSSPGGTARARGGSSPMRPSATSWRARAIAGHAAVGEADHGPHAAAAAAFCGRGDHLLGLLDGVGQRLLAQHVLAGLERGDGDLGVGVARGADVDEVDVVALDQPAPVGLGRAPSRAGRPRPRRGSASRPPSTRIAGSQRQVEEAGRGAPGLRVGGAHEGVADHADAELGGRVVGSGGGGAWCCSCGASGGSGAGGRRPGQRRTVASWRRDGRLRDRARSARLRTRRRSSRYLSTLSAVTTGAKSWTWRGHLDLDEVVDRLLLGQQAGQLEAVGALGRGVDDRGLEDAVAGLDVAHGVGRAGAADHEELVAAGVLDGRQDADALVVVVVPDGVDLRRGLQQVGGGLLAALDGEVGGDAVVDVEAAVAERVLEALAAVLGQRQGVDARRSRRPRRRACRRAARRCRCRPRRPCRSCRRAR